jgi:hypothetical protein
MKAMEKSLNRIHNNESRPAIISNYNDAKIELKTFRKSNHLYLLQLELTSINGDSYRIFLSDSYLKLVLSEIRELIKPVYIHNLSQKEFDNVGYEVMKSVELWLPGDNFYLVKHFFIPKTKILNIYLGRSFQRNYA